MSVAGSQAQTVLRLLKQLQPRWHRDFALPAFIQTLLARERRFGSRDRRLYRELIYTTLRYLPWIEPFLVAQAFRLPSDPAETSSPPLPTDASDEAIRRIAWLAADTPATRAFRAAFATGEPPAGNKEDLLPGWFRSHCPEIFSGEELAAQLRRAPLWLRLQTAASADVLNEFDARGWRHRASPLLPDAIEILDEADVTKSDAWQRGDFEVQDLGSQMILESIGLEPGGRWLDACAGAGGKTLQLARLLGSAGTVDAHDTRPAALEELKRRAARATHSTRSRGNVCHPLDDRGTAAIRVQTGAPDTTKPGAAGMTDATHSIYDGVLVDAPCSGSGTWRRSPHLKWTTTPALIAERAALQQKLLAQFATAVRSGGRLVYATCSLSTQENEDVVAAFLAAHPEFEPAPFARTFDALPRGAGLLILPARHNTDGFFVASLRRK